MGFFDNNFPATAAFGTRNGYVSTAATTNVAVRATVYTAQASAAQRSVKSSSANDTAAGTGARSVRVTYYDNLMAGPKTEDIILNGTTAVNTVNTDIQYIERIDVLTTGSTQGNAGTISLMAAVAGGGATIGTVAAGDNGTFWAHHYVAAGLQAYVRNVRVCSSVVAGASNLQASGDPALGTGLPSKIVSGTLRHGTTTLVVPWDPPLVVQGPALLIMNDKPDAATANVVFAAFDYVEF